MCYVLRRTDSVSGQSFGQLVYADFSNISHETVEFRCVSIVVDGLTRSLAVLRLGIAFH